MTRASNSPEGTSDGPLGALAEGKIVTIRDISFQDSNGCWSSAPGGLAAHVDLALHWLVDASQKKKSKIFDSLRRFGLAETLGALSGDCNPRQLVRGSCARVAYPSALF